MLYLSTCDHEMCVMQQSIVQTKPSMSEGITGTAAATAIFTSTATADNSTTTAATVATATAAMAATAIATATITDTTTTITTTATTTTTTTTTTDHDIHVLYKGRTSKERAMRNMLSQLTSDDSKCFWKPYQLTIIIKNRLQTYVLGGKSEVHYRKQTRQVVINEQK